MLFELQFTEQISDMIINDFHLSNSSADELYQRLKVNRISMTQDECISSINQCFDDILNQMEPLEIISRLKKLWVAALEIKNSGDKRIDLFIQMFPAYEKRLKEHLEIYIFKVLNATEACFEKIQSNTFKPEDFNNFIERKIKQYPTKEEILHFNDLILVDIAKTFSWDEIENYIGILNASTQFLNESKRDYCKQILNNYIYENLKNKLKKVPTEEDNTKKTF